MYWRNFTLADFFPRSPLPVSPAPRSLSPPLPPPCLPRSPLAVSPAPRSLSPPLPPPCLPRYPLPVSPATPSLSPPLPPPCLPLYPLPVSPSPPFLSPPLPPPYLPRSSAPCLPRYPLPVSSQLSVSSTAQQVQRTDAFLIATSVMESLTVTTEKMSTIVVGTLSVAIFNTHIHFSVYGNYYNCNSLCMRTLYGNYYSNV